MLALAPYAYYRLDETSGTVARDSSGNGRNGTYAGTSGTNYLLGQTSIVPGVAASMKAFTANPGSPKVVLPTLNLGSSPTAWVSDFTVALWAQPDPSQLSQPNAVVEINNYFMGQSAGTAGSSGTIPSMGGYPNGGTYFATSGTFADGNPHFLAQTVHYNASGYCDLYLYVDGALAQSAVNTHCAGGPLNGGIGSRLSSSSGSAGYFGEIGGVALFSKALTAGQIANLYAPPAPPGPGYDSAVLGLAPYAYYRLDETSGTVARDSSGNGRNGTYAGTSGTNYLLGQTSIVPGVAASMKAFTANPGTPKVVLPSLNLGSSPTAWVSDFTVALWAQPDPSQLSQPNAVVEINNYFMGQSAGTAGSSGTIPSMGGYPNGGTYFAPSGTFADGNPHFLAQTVHYNASGYCDLYLYVDGALAQSALNTHCAGGPLNGGIGSRLSSSSGSAGYFGEIGGVALFSKALTAAQIASLFKSTPTSYVGSFSEVPTGTSFAPGLIGLGATGQVWFAPFETSGSSPNVGWIDESNAVHFANTTTSLFDRNGIVLGPDGNEWFADQLHDQVGFLTPGGAVSLFPLTSGSHPIGLTVGSDAAIWIAENGTGKIGRITVQGAYTEYGGTLSDVRTVALGPDGNVWFSEHGNSKIGKITPVGSITEYAVPSGGAPAVIKPGPGGNMWFTEYESNRIALSTTSGAITEFAAPGGPNGLTTGPDGNVWYAEFSANGVGEISPSGSLIAQYSTPTVNSHPYDVVGSCDALYVTERDADAIGVLPLAPPASVGQYTEISTGSAFSGGLIALGVTGKVWFAPFQTSGSSPDVGWLDQSNNVNFINTTTTLSDRNGIVLGPDGNEWFADQSHDQVGFVTPIGAVTLFPLSSGSHPIGITVGSDAAIWIAENGAGKIGRISVQGSYTEYGAGLSDVRTVARGADGNVWFSEHGNDKVGKVTTAGSITEYAIPSGGAPAVVAPGPDGNMWFTEYETSRVGYSTPSGAITEFLAQGGPNGLTTGPDGNIWYAEFAGNAVGVMSPTGTPVAQYAASANSHPYDIVGTCNKVYFTERGVDAIGVISVR